ncbi:hypothetical protein C8Q70DRAFT_191816 [Cubamyces menziesii]|nr:hypothetical protein C8Q70DRAFT_191816 [Cubamyces menziesii]
MRHVTLCDSELEVLYLVQPALVNIPWIPRFFLCTKLCMQPTSSGRRRRYHYAFVHYQYLPIPGLFCRALFRPHLIPMREVTLLGPLMVPSLLVLPPESRTPENHEISEPADEHHMYHSSTQLPDGLDSCTCRRRGRHRRLCLPRRHR